MAEVVNLKLSKMSRTGSHYNEVVLMSSVFRQKKQNFFLACFGMNLSYADAVPMIKFFFCHQIDLVIKFF